MTQNTGGERFRNEHLGKTREKSIYGYKSLHNWREEEENLLNIAHNSGQLLESLTTPYVVGVTSLN